MHLKHLHRPIEVVPTFLERCGVGFDPEHRGELVALSFRVHYILDLGHLGVNSLQVPGRLR